MGGCGGCYGLYTSSVKNQRFLTASPQGEAFFSLLLKEKAFLRCCCEKTGREVAPSRRVAGIFFVFFNAFWLVARAEKEG